MFGSICRLMRGVVVAVAGVVWAAGAFGQPSTVEHVPDAGAFGQASGVTQRSPAVPRQDESVDLFVRVSFQFTYDRVCVYYTADGSDPTGSFGTPGGSTQVLRNDLGSVVFLYNESNGGTRDWWKATLPAGARAYGQTVKYKLSAWKPFNGGEVFANGGAAYVFVNKLAWPGAGAGQANPGAGYPPVSFYKEEPIIGNTYCAAQLDQNGTYYDFHFPTPGGVQGVGTRNEGYVDGADTFPPGLPAGWRGQMHLNQAMTGIRIDGTTHWMSNPGGVSYAFSTAGYQRGDGDGFDTNGLATFSAFTQGGNNIRVTQYDFAPMGVAFPSDAQGNPVRHIAVKRMLLTNDGATKTVGVYFYMDPALNGGDGYDSMFFDAGGGALCAFDKTNRTVTGTGTGFSSPDEYNPTTFGGYNKDIALYLAASMNVRTSPGAASGTKTGESWRDTSGDNGQGWIGSQVVLPAGQTVEVDFILVGGWKKPIPISDTIYDDQLRPALDWFHSTSMEAVQTATDDYWRNWLNAGVRFGASDSTHAKVFDRSLLATELHVDGVNGGVIAGFHNGAYPYVWPRDAVYAAVTLANTGHTSEATGVYRWMRDTCYRDFEGWGRKGFWKQKYSTDGYVIWGAPQIDETAVFPWGVWNLYTLTADTGMLDGYVEQVRDAVLSTTQDSFDSRLRYEDAYGLMYSNNVWEDSYDTFVYSNANVVRGLTDSARIFGALGLGAEAADASSRASTIKAGLDARLAWDGENTDISALGVSYPFGVYSPTDARVAHIVDRINGVASDGFGNNHPLMNYSGENQGTVNRYFGDGYWNGGPWFLSTLWYGLYYAQRADYTAGTGDIDNHLMRLQGCIDRLGPAGLGAEQMSGSNSLLYPDFVLQAAWPNAWESMSTMADSYLAFLGFTPDASAERMAFSPKLPSIWSSMTFTNIQMTNTPSGRSHRVTLRVDGDTGNGLSTHTFTNTSGFALRARTAVRVSPGATVYSVLRNGMATAYAYDSANGIVSVDEFDLETGAMAETTIAVSTACPADFDQDGSVDFFDYDAFVVCFEGGDCPNGKTADFDQDGTVDFFDYDAFVVAFEAGC